MDPKSSFFLSLEKEIVLIKKHQNKNEEEINENTPDSNLKMSSEARNSRIMSSKNFWIAPSASQAVHSSHKRKSLTITKEGDKTNESTQVFGDYKEVNGLLFPHSLSMNMGPMILSGKVVKVEVNGKPDMKLFKK